MAQDANGSTRGLVILWNLEEVWFEDWVSIPRILSGRFRVIKSKDWVLLTGVYGPHILEERRVFLQNLAKLRSIYPDDLWMVGGDFNIITSLAEKRGGMRRMDTDMELFRDTIAKQRPVDIPTINGVNT